MKKLFVLCMVFIGAIAGDKTPLLQAPSVQGAPVHYHSVAKKEGPKQEESQAPAKKSRYIVKPRPGAEAPKQQ